MDAPRWANCTCRVSKDSIARFYGATIKAPKMKTIGLIGGMSWESTSSYYSLINRTVNERLGKNHSASCLIYSFNFQEIEDLQYVGKWDELEAGCYMLPML